MDNISNSFKRVGNTTKAFSILGIVIGSIFSIVGLFFISVLKGFDAAGDSEVGYGGAVLALALVFVVVLAALWYIGLIMLIPSIIFLIVGINLKKYSNYDIITLKEKKNKIILMIIPYVVFAALLIAFSILWIIANGIEMLIYLIIPTVLLVLGINSLFKNLRYINEYKVEENLN